MGADYSNWIIKKPNINGIVVVEKDILRRLGRINTTDVGIENIPVEEEKNDVCVQDFENSVPTVQETVTVASVNDELFTGEKNNPLSILKEWQRKYLSRQAKKEFWMVVKGITGQNYRKIDIDIPVEDIIAINKHFDMLEKNMWGRSCKNE
ncbi:hypothetical protein M0P98_08260 [bacterium]|nr:hypothetical protein [bacterium]